MGDITGPKLSPKSTPPYKVDHLNAGIRILEDEPAVTLSLDGDNFPDDRNTCVVPKAPLEDTRFFIVHTYVDL